MTVGRRTVRLAGLLAVLAQAATLASAQAGDLAEVAAPHLGACGPVAGAYQLPGTDGCLRVSGFVAADIGGWRTPTAALVTPMQTPTPALAVGDISRSSIAADTRLSADVRIPTDYGPARVYVSVRGRHGVLSSGH